MKYIKKIKAKISMNNECLDENSYKIINIAHHKK